MNSILEDTLHRVIVEDMIDTIDDVIDNETPHDICDCDCDTCAEAYKQVMIEDKKLDEMIIKI